VSATSARRAFFSTIATFGTAVAELAIEAFFPADPATAAYVAGASAMSSASAGSASASKRTA
jgi:hypothetical protein